MTTALYERASSEKQDVDGVSIETQHDTVVKFCEYKGYENIKLYTEIKSARSMKGRVKLQELMDDVKNKRVKRIVIYKLDRLTRSLRDLMNLLHTLDQYDCELHSTYENIDTSSPSGRMLVQVLGMIAEWESANTSMRVKNAMQFKAEQGMWMSSVPYGFDLTLDQSLIVNEEEADILKEGFTLVERGNSFTATENVLINRYNLDWSQGYLLRKAKMHSTVGDTFRNGNIIENTHEGIISKKKQDKLIEIAESRGTGRRGDVEKNDVFRRRVVCYECGSIMNVTSRSHNNYKTVSHNYTCEPCYKAKRPFISVSEKNLLDAFYNYMTKLKVTDLDNVNEKDDTSKNIIKLKNNLKSIEKKRDRIQRAWIDGKMKDEDLDKYQNEIDIEEKEIKRELDEFSMKRNIITNEEIAEIKELFSNHFKELTQKEKRSFVQQHIKKVHFQRTLVKGYKKKYNTKVTNIEFF